jgi:hypothetical protein
MLLMPKQTNQICSKNPLLEALELILKLYQNRNLKGPKISSLPNAAEWFRFYNFRFAFATDKVVNRNSTYLQVFGYL